MMDKLYLKIVLWLLLALIFLGFSLAAMRGTTALMAYFQQGADPASALNIVPNVPPDLKVKLAWLPDDPDTGREVDPLTRREIEAAYLRAWLQWNISYQKGEPYGLQTYFVGAALDAVEMAVRKPTESGWQLAQVDTEHLLKLHLYSADGSIVSFTDQAANIIQVLRDGDGKDVHTDETVAVYDVVMFLEDGNWRVRHWVRRSSRSPFDPAVAQEIDTLFASAVITRSLTTPDDTLQPTIMASVAPLAHDEELPRLITQLNSVWVYDATRYPLEKSSQNFWGNYTLASEVELLEANFWREASQEAEDEEQFAKRQQAFEQEREALLRQAELSRATLEEAFYQLQQTGRQLIRISIPYATFGDSEIDLIMLNRLIDFLDKAYLHDLKVIITLFPEQPRDNLLLWPQMDHHLEMLLSHLKYHPAILGWDVAPEASPGQQKTAVAWLHHIQQIYIEDIDTSGELLIIHH